MGIESTRREQTLALDNLRLTTSPQSYFRQSEFAH
jgi:hypothetical protein